MRRQNQKQFDMNRMNPTLFFQVTQIRAGIRNYAMRNLYDLQISKSRHEAEIKRLKEEDERFPRERIYENTIESLEGVLQYLNRRIHEETQGELDYMQ